MTPDEERAAIGKTLDALEQASGIRALGWATPAYSWTEHTFDLLLQAGVRWYADALDISLPRKQKTASGDIVAFPWSDFVDNRVLRGAPRVHSNTPGAGQRDSGSIHLHRRAFPCPSGCPDLSRSDIHLGTMSEN